MNKINKIKIACFLFVVIILTILTMGVRLKTIAGDEIGVKETWSKGVVDVPLQPKTYVYFPVMEDIYVYKASSTTYVMNDKGDEEFGEGRRNDSYEVQSKEGQSMRISLNVRYHLDISKIITIHKTVRDNIEERILRPEIMRVVKDEATTRTALDAYSGDGLVSLQNSIFQRLSSQDGDLQKRGVVVENFVIEEISLDNKYIAEIQRKQIAVQAALRAVEETKAAEQEASKAKAVAQADYEKAVVEARRDKEVGILSAEKSAQQQILAAQADAKKVELSAEAQKKQAVLEAEGIAQAGELKAKSILAIGQAEAEATKLKLAAYNTDGADSFVKIQVSANMAEAYKNIKGYLPESMNVTLLSSQFDEAVSLIVNPEKDDTK